MRVVDLFSGCGGMSLGFENAGFDVVAAFDHWRPAINVYRKNFDHEIFETDLLVAANTPDMFAAFKPDVIIGGPPCQDFSHAGKRNEEGGRANLTVSFAQIVGGVKPKWFVMENVERIVSSKRLPMVKQTLKDAGYGITIKVLNASLCGVPQKRKRFFMIGEMGGKDGALLPHLEQNLSKQPMTVRDYLGDGIDVEHYYRHPRNYSRRAVYSIDEPSMTIRGVNRPIPSTYKSHPGDSTIVGPHVRPLTTKERSLIQTFPQDFVLEGSKTNLELMIGNAVPVKLAEYVATAIAKYSDGDTSCPEPKTLFDVLELDEIQTVSA